jgi:LmbE family N-acetylglucosaminyl deacetylase
MKRPAGLALCLLTFLIAGQGAASATAPPAVPPLLPGVQSVLWIAAHPDDEIFASPLLGRLCLDEHRQCTLLVLTRGEHGQCLLAGGCHPDLAAVRSAEMARAARLLGARLTLWSLPDGGTAADGSAGAWDAAAGGHEALLARLASFIASTKADLVLTFDPRHGSTCHSDHRATGGLVVEALGSLPKKPLLYLLETRLAERESPFAVSFTTAAPAQAGAFAFDANTPLVATGQPAWQILLQDLQMHPSQFDARLRKAVRAIPPAGRAVFVGPVELLLASNAVASCGQ